MATVVDHRVVSFDVIELSTANPDVGHYMNPFAAIKMQVRRIALKAQPIEMGVLTQLNYGTDIQHEALR